MQFKFFILVFIAALAFEKIKINAQECGIRLCPPTDSCCELHTGEFQCYNLSRQNCFNTQNVCRLGDLICNNECYNKNTHECININGTQVLCGRGLEVCGAACYDPLKYSCREGSLVGIPETLCGSSSCSNGQLCCRTTDTLGNPREQCFDPQTQICCTQGFGISFPSSIGLVCQAGEQCCPVGLNSTCYSSSQSYCCPRSSPAGGQGAILCDLSELSNEQGSCAACNFGFRPSL